MTEVQGDAVLSPCGKYRYKLTRQVMEARADTKGSVLFVMLNPSTADATKDDPTIRRCKAFARRWGYDALTVVNLYAYRATNPKELLKAEDPVGPENDYWIYTEGREHSMTVCAWGGNAKPQRAEQVTRMLKESGTRLVCLNTTLAGAPGHPLYIKADSPPIPYPPASIGEDLC